MSEMNYELYMDTAMLAGKIMLESSAESYRVEETVTRILRLTELEMVDAMALTTGLIATLDSPNMDAITVVKRIAGRAVNLNKITKVNDVSRSLVEGRISIDEAYYRLSNIDEAQYDELLRAMAIAGIVQSFVLLFGGGLYEFGTAVSISLFVAVASHFGRRWQVRSFILDMIISFGTALLTSGISFFLPAFLQGDLLIISGIMPLLPGTALTTGVRDIFRGDYMSGGAKVLEAFIIAIFIALGIGSGLLLGRRLFL